MKEIEIQRNLNLNEDQTIALESHSFLNIMNILTMELMHLSILAGEEESLNPTIQNAFKIAEILNSSEALEQIKGLDKEIERFNHTVARFFTKHHKLKDIPDALESRENIRSVQDILKVRIQELLARLKAPDAWVAHDIEALTNNFAHVFAAIEKNSKGRYRIIYNIAAQEDKDYYVDLKIESVDAPIITMPPILQDVFRDLIANARKYTQPGGRISAGLCDNGKHISLIVDDNGCGIPEDELETVVEFGARAQNTMRKRTMGGGFGLTKAYFITKRFGGKMWIRSELDKGTRVTIHIPRPA